MESAIWQMEKEVDIDGLERKIHESFFELGEKRVSKIPPALIFF